MAQDDRVEIIMEGLAEDEGRVRLSTFMGQLQKLGAVLTKLDRESNEGKSVTVFQVVELSYNSPLRVVLEPKSVNADLAIGQLVVTRLNRVATAIKIGGDLSDFDADLLEDIRGLAMPVGKSLNSVTLISGGYHLDLTEKIGHVLDDALAVEDQCDGSLEGDLDQINVHQGANIFHIYPSIGPRRVTCHFPAKLFDDAVASVGRRVEVVGLLKYRARAQFPHQIAVRELDVLPRESELPDWDDLRGRAPNATGPLSSEAFIRELRDAW